MQDWIFKILHMMASCCFFLAGILFASEDVYVTCALDGQLGNQMFQIAAAVAYAKDHEMEARFPLIQQALNGELNRRFVFHRVNAMDFPQDCEFRSYHESEQVVYDGYAPIPYDPGKNICISGYYQNEKYFAHHANYIRNLFAPTEEILHEIHKKYGDILEKLTVAIHLRTFLLEGTYPDIGGITEGNWKYYIDAVNMFSEDYTFLVFSDYPEWAKQNFPRIRKNMHFIEGNPHYIDFYFMSLCKHQVVSPKSTFSWWAAWLNLNPDKVVIAPDYLKGGIDDGVYPISWIRKPFY
jgi:hypothetical protein